MNLTLAWDDLKRDLDAEAARLAGEVRASFAGGAILDGTGISIATARMIACDAGIIPVVSAAPGRSAILAARPARGAPRNGVRC